METPPAQIARQLEPIQIASMVFIMLSIALIVALMAGDKKKRGWYVLPLTWLLHGALFYLALTLDRAGRLPFDVTYTDWSAYVRLHTYITAFIILAGLYYGFRVRRSNGHRHNS